MAGWFRARTLLLLLWPFHGVWPWLRAQAAPLAPCDAPSACVGQLPGPTVGLLHAGQGLLVNSVGWAQWSELRV